MGLIIKSLGLASLLLALYIGYTCLEVTPLPDVDQDAYWGPGEKTAEQSTIKPFKIAVSKSRLSALKVALSEAKYAKPVEEAGFEYGFNNDYLKEVVNYWSEKYSWKEWEDRLNLLPQFMTSIDGLDIHYVHLQGVNKDLMNVHVLLLHGWPGSFVEFYKVIPILQEEGKKAGLNINLVIPSIPGYAFSEASHKKGFSHVSAGVIFKKLMLRLGYDKFVIQGGDWGSIIGQTMATLYPEHVIGYHTNMPIINSRPKYMIYQIFVSIFPTLFMEGAELKAYQESLSLFKFVGEELGYFHIQASKPDTAGVGLLNSPVGLAAYILEKFSTWTNTSYRQMNDGGLTEMFTLDEVLTNVMIYWVTDSITSSMRLYKENFHSIPPLEIGNVPNQKVPTAVAAFAGELKFVPECLARTSHWNIIQYTPYLSGGHFAAFEKPDVLSKDLVSFLSAITEGAGHH